MAQKKFVALMVVAAVMLAVIPSKSLAQTPAQAKAVEGGHTFSGTPLKKEAGLKAVFAEEVARAKARASGLDHKRIKEEQQGQSPQQNPRKGWSKREKVALIVFIGVMLAITTALLIRGINTEPNCFEEIFDPRCTE